MKRKRMSFDVTPGAPRKFRRTKRHDQEVINALNSAINRLAGDVFGCGDTHDSAYLFVERGLRFLLSKIENRN